MARSTISKRRRWRLRGKARGFSLSEAFAPRSDMPAADSVPVLTRGSIGRRTIEIETAVANLKYDGAMKLATLDFEASSIHGWPIEVGWMREGDDKPRSMLIRPAPCWSMAEWSEDSGQVHYISPRDLERDGVDVRQVVDALEADLAGFTVVSDAPHLDQRWLARLCEAAGRPVPFTIEASPTVSKVGPVRHRAGPDAEQLLRAIVAARPDHADAEFAAAFLAQKGSIPDDVEIGYGPDALTVLADLVKRVERRRAFTTAELSPEQIKLIEESRMDGRHDNLNRLLDD